MASVPDGEVLLEGPPSKIQKLEDVQANGTHVKGLGVDSSLPLKVKKLSKVQANGAHTKCPAVDSRAQLKVKKLSTTAILPSRGSALAAGYDLSSAYDAVVPARGKELIKTELSIAVPEGTYARIAPRSGLAWKHSIDVGAGVIDADYRGPVGVILFNHSDQDFTVKAGDRVAQLILEKIITPEVVEVDDLEDTPRGAEGFGSTGIKEVTADQMREILKTGRQTPHQMAGFRRYFPMVSSSNLQDCKDLDESQAEVLSTQVLRPKKLRVSRPIRRTYADAVKVGNRKDSQPPKQQRKTDISHIDTKARGKRWKEHWVITLIHVRGEMQEEFSKPPKQGVNLWQKVFVRLSSTCPDFDKDSESCRKKWQAIYVDYREDNSMNAMSGNARSIKCRWFDLVDRYMRDRAQVICYAHESAQANNNPVTIPKESPRALPHQSAQANSNPATISEGSHALTDQSAQANNNPATISEGSPHTPAHQSVQATNNLATIPSGSPHALAHPSAPANNNPATISAASPHALAHQNAQANNNLATISAGSPHALAHQNAQVNNNPATIAAGSPHALVETLQSNDVAPEIKNPPSKKIKATVDHYQTTLDDIAMCSKDMVIQVHETRLVMNSVKELMAQMVEKM